MISDSKKTQENLNTKKSKSIGEKTVLAAAITALTIVICLLLAGVIYATSSYSNPSRPDKIREKKFISEKAPKPVQPEPKPVQPEPKPVQPEPKPVQPEPKPAVWNKENLVLKVKFNDEYDALWNEREHLLTKANVSMNDPEWMENVKKFTAFNKERFLPWFSYFKKDMMGLGKALFDWNKVEYKKYDWSLPEKIVYANIAYKKVNEFVKKEIAFRLAKKKVNDWIGEKETQLLDGKKGLRIRKKRWDSGAWDHPSISNARRNAAENKIHEMQGRLTRSFFALAKELEITTSNKLRNDFLNELKKHVSNRSQKKINKFVEKIAVLKVLKNNEKEIVD